MIIQKQLEQGLIKYSHPDVKEVKLNLICFPFAGGGTVNYAKWRKDVAKEIDLYALNLPGRERFFRQPFFTDYPDFIHNLAEVIHSLSSTPFIFFGHSFGGLTAYLTALELRKCKYTGPNHLFISARIPPLAENLGFRFSDLDEKRFLDALTTLYQGIPQEILENTSFLDLFLTIIKKDFELYEQYPALFDSYSNKQILCDLTSIGYNEDRTSTSHGADSPEKKFSKWAQYTQGNYQHIQLPGGHFEILKNWKELIELVHQCNR